MPKIGYVQNGVKRRKKGRNPSAGKTASVGRSKNSAKRRSLGLSSVKSFAKRNGLKLVARGTVINPKRKKGRGKRRNGIETPRRFSLSRNGIFGNTKSDAKQVGSLLGGMAVTKLLSRVVTPFLAPHLAKVGVGAYAEVIVDAGIALTVVPFIAGKIGSGETAKLARLGGLAVVGIDLIDKFAPDSLGMINPFNTNPVIVNGGQVAVAPKAVAALVNQTSATPQEKAAVAGAMNQLEAGAMASAGARGGMNRNQVLPFGSNSLQP